MPKTQFAGPVFSGLDTGSVETRTLGAVRLTQATTVEAAPVTAAHLFTLPPNSRICEISVMVRSAPGGDARLRFSTNGTVGIGSDNLGSIALSGVGRFQLNLGTANGTAQTTRPFLTLYNTSVQVYGSLIQASGSVGGFAGNVIAEVTYVRPNITDHQSTSTIYSGVIRTGNRSGSSGPDGTAVARLTQSTTIASSPVSGAVVAVLPSQSLINEVNIYLKTSLAAEGLVRLSLEDATGNSNNLGSVVVSGAGKYTVTMNTAMVTLPMGLNTQATSRPVYLTISSVSGSVAPAANAMIAEVVYTRLDPDLSGNTFGKTNFKGNLVSGLNDETENSGSLSNRIKGAGFARFSVITTVSAVPLGTTLLGTLPPGAVLSEMNVYNSTVAAGEISVRGATVITAGSNNLGFVSVSAPGKYSVLLGTAQNTQPFGVNATGSAQSVYFSTANLSGTNAAQNAMMIEMVYYRPMQDIYMES